jgi:hypothetical protein
MHEDAERLAKRFYEVSLTLAAGMGMEPVANWEDIDEQMRALAVQTFDEMLKAQLLFPGPSLYSAGDSA